MSCHARGLVARTFGAVLPGLLAVSLLQALERPASAAGKARKTSAGAGVTLFHRGAWMTWKRFESNDNPRLCGGVSLSLTSSDFFEGLIRVHDTGAMQFRYSKGSQPVDQFPDAIGVEIRATLHDCDDPLERPIPPLTVAAFMTRLRFEFCWMRGAQAKPAKTILSQRHAEPLPADGSFPQWRYYFQIRSSQISINEDLSVRVMSPEGRELVRLVSGMDKATPLQ